MSLRNKMLAVMADVNASVSEREELVELIAIALLTRKNLFILGDPGQAKSYAINAFRSRITGVKQFERLLSKQTAETILFTSARIPRRSSPMSNFSVRHASMSMWAPRKKAHIRPATWRP